MILIASGAYLQGEFTSEVGLLPPSFLPIGNKRLYEYQVAFLKHCSMETKDLYLSIPTSYELDSFDESRLDILGVKVLKVPDTLTLGESLLYCWNATTKHHSSLKLLHGDTLFLSTCFQNNNAISVHTNHGFYKRATLGKEADALEDVHDDWSNDCEQVLSGFFSFSDPLFFMKSLIEAKSDFVQGIVNYHQTCPLELVSGGDWLDFGHINSFYRSRTRMTTQRVFNELSIGLRMVSKASKQKSKKIYAEGNWFAQLPLPLRLYTPALLGLEQGDDEYCNAKYQLEYLYLMPLSDLFVFSRLVKGYWQSVFNSIAEMLTDFGRFTPKQVSVDTLEQINSLYLLKTLARLQEYQQQSGFDVVNAKLSWQGGKAFSLVEVAEISARSIKGVQAQDVCIVHGDLCFSNMLFDSRVEAIKCIDPRGISAKGELTLYGDCRYDLAKLYHSLIGLYDLIIAGHFQLEQPSEHDYQLKFSHNEVLYQEMVESFREQIVSKSNYSESEILAITIHLFLSMLPLHSDHLERQQAFIANALRLFTQLQEEAL